MTQNKCIILGTGTSQGIPVIGCRCEVCASPNPRDKRLRTAALLMLEEVNIVIDTGPDFRQQMLSAKVSHLDAIVLTHQHNDHVIGLDDIRPFNFMQQQALQLYAKKEVINDIKLRFDYIFATNKYPGAPSLEVVEVGEEVFAIKGHSITPIFYMHGSLPVLGIRYKNFAYLTDIKSMEEAEKRKLEGLSTLVVSALHHDSHHAHFNLEEALHFIEEIKPKKAYLTHLSHKMGLTQLLSADLPSNVSVAYDGLEIIIE